MTPKHGFTSFRINLGEKVLVVSRFSRVRYGYELPFSLGGVIFSFTPGTGFLQTFAADAPCVAAWTADVNLRGGPGTNYPIRRGVTGGFYGNPDARAIGSDSAVWWRLVDGVWIAAHQMG